MEKVMRVFKRWSFSFFFILGVMQLLNIAALFLPLAPVGANISRFANINSLVIALVFSICHSLIMVDEESCKIGMKARLTLCGLLCLPGCALLVWNFGLPGIFLRLLQEGGVAVELNDAVAVWWMATILNFLLFVAIYALCEIRYCRLGRKYTEALVEYKEKMAQSS